LKFGCVDTTVRQYFKFQVFSYTNKQQINKSLYAVLKLHLWILCKQKLDHESLLYSYKNQRQNNNYAPFACQIFMNWRRNSVSSKVLCFITFPHLCAVNKFSLKYPLRRAWFTRRSISWQGSCCFPRGSCTPSQSQWNLTADRSL
jgi:hypothetical protein